MVHIEPTENRYQVVGVIPLAVLPAGVIAQAWLKQYSRRLTWAELTTWLRGD